MRILMLGGTIFLGRHIARIATQRGHDVTLFHRGRHGVDLHPQAERILADRDGGLDALDHGSWDVVIDTSGYVPRVVDASAQRLTDVCDHYAFVSTLSVYAETSTPHQDETATLATLAEPETETIDGVTYGPLKARCEQAVEARMPGRTLVLRPGLIVGPDDPTDRFTYWPVRVARGGDVLCPEHPGWRTQWIDVRDLAAWILDLSEARTTGVFNAVGPDEPMPFGRLLETCRHESSSDARFVWVDHAFLESEGVSPWQDVPLWVPDVPEHAGFSAVDASRARAAGLRFRPVAETVRDTLAFARGRPEPHAWRAGLPPAREAQLLEAWRQRGT